VGGGTVALGVDTVGVDCTSGWDVGEWIMETSTGVSVAVGGISGT
jgi:hypothetical protein